MASFFNNFLHGLAAGDHVKDYRHASNLFSHDNFRLAPKFRYLYHCVIVLNRSVAQQTFDQAELGFMVKAVDLPGISIDVETLNQYNRTAYNYGKVHYSPVSITFHDDNHNNVRNFLANYYSYYFGDGNKQPAEYNIRTGGGLRNTFEENNQIPGGSWGLDSAFTQSYGLNLIKEITIYSLSKGKGTSYTLKNPVITEYSHGSHEASDGVSPMEHTINLNYDAIVYGDVGIGSIPNFGSGFYDKAPSALSGGGRGTNSVIGPGGMFDKGMDVFGNLKSGNLLGAAVGAFQLREQVRANDVRDLLKNELKDSLPSAVDIITRNAGNRFPTATMRKAAEIRGAEAAGSGDSGGASGPDLGGST